jgi:hypothetical protein
MRETRIPNAPFIALFLAAVFFSFTQPLKMGDFWWHLNTGRWIWENLGLPSEDPFTYTATEGYDSRKSIILKGFWLAQALYYFMYKYLDFQGLILFKAALFTVLFYVLWKTLVRKGLDGLMSLMLLAPLVFLTERFEEVRPQAFSFLFTVLLYNCSEKILYALRHDRPLRPGHYMNASLIMLFWSNLHRGFMIGHAVLGVYMISETIKYVLKKNALGNASFRRFIIWVLAAMVASLANPNHLNAFAENVWELTSSSFVLTIEEYMSPWDYAAFFDIPNTLYGLAALGLVSLAILVISWRRLELSHALLYSGFALAAVNAFRFCMFFMIISTAIAGGYLTPLTKTKRIQKRLRAAAALVVLACTVIISTTAFRESFVSRGLIDRTYMPEEAVNFMHSYNLPAPLFNPYEWGAYISWRLYPSYKVFVDARALDPSVHGKYKTAKLGKKTEVFNEYGIRTVIFYPVNPVSNEVPALIFSLLRDSRWRLVYLDNKSSIFLKRGAMPSVPSLGKELLWNSLTNWYIHRAEVEPGNANTYVQLGIIHQARDDSKTALEYFNKALSIDPEDQSTKEWIKWIQRNPKGEKNAK